MQQQRLAAKDNVGIRCESFLCPRGPLGKGWAFHLALMRLASKCSVGPECEHHPRAGQNENHRALTLDAESGSAFSQGPQ